ncbi:MAG: cyclic nucleotide-binding domain-containing protein [Pseudomonadota bacterium]
MSVERNTMLLARLPLFQVFNEQQLRLIAFGAETITLKSNELLFRLGEPADCAFLILDGAVELSVESDRGLVPQDVARSGVLMGGLALINSVDRPAQGVALVSTTLLRLRRSLIQRVFQEYPDSAARLHESMSNSLQAFMKDLQRAEQLLTALDD